jgi:hypothetical protein
MDYSIDMTSTLDDNNDKKVTFEDMALRWSKRLAMLTKMTKGCIGNPNKSRYI